MNMKKIFSVKTLTLAAITAALYVVFTLLSNALGLALGVFEFRLSEGLTILPVFTPAAVPGLTVGCLLANLLVGGIPLDVALGSAASLLGALGTYLFREKKLLPYLCPIVSNTLIVSPVLYFAYGFGHEFGFVLFTLIFLAGEAGSVFLFGFLFRKALTPIRKFLK